MSLIGLDLNSSRLRAVGGTGRQSPAPLPLERDQLELPAALSVEGRAAEPGTAGLKLARLRPHAACLDFLPHLGTGQTWAGPRVRVTANDALALVLAAAARALGRNVGCLFSVPAYLDDLQVVAVQQAAEAAKQHFLGTVSAPQAAVLARLAADPLEPITGLSLVVDCDGHALTWAVVDCSAGHCGTRLLRVSPTLGRHAWMRRLMDGVAGRFIRQSRYDPRESAAAEQALYEQLLNLLGGHLPSLIPLALQGPGWSHHLMMPADDLIAYVGPCLRQAAGELDALLAEIEPLGGVHGAVLTATAAALPGLNALVRSRVRPRPAADEGDYGDAMLRTISGDPVRALGPDALASAAHALAVRVHAGHAPRGHLPEAPLPAGAAAGTADSGPARLHFRGQDHRLPRTAFVLGRDPSCDLVFETELYPHVSARHCEITFDRRHYTVHDRSRYGTLLNERPVNNQAALHSGDWIRLGPRGPVLRFLGQVTG